MKMYTPGRFKGRSKKQNRLIRRPPKGIGKIEAKHPFMRRNLDGSRLTSFIFDDEDGGTNGQ
jgi:hypothetical protein